MHVPNSDIVETKRVVFDELDNEDSVLAAQTERLVTSENEIGLCTKKGSTHRSVQT